MAEPEPHDSPLPPPPLPHHRELPTPFDPPPQPCHPPLKTADFAHEEFPSLSRAGKSFCLGDAVDGRGSTGGAPGEMPAAGGGRGGDGGSDLGCGGRTHEDVPETVAHTETEASQPRRVVDQSEDYDPAEPLAMEDLIGKDEEEEEDDVQDKDDGRDGENGVLGFLKTAPADDDGTVEEQFAFVRELENFFRERNLEYKHPKFYGENLNCLKLWRAVVRLGGYESVTTGKLWRQVGETFNPPKTCTTVSWSFRGFYEKALLDYEKFKLHGIQPNSGQGVLQSEVPLQGAECPSTASLSGSLQACAGSASGSGRARRDAAARAMQGWHSQRFFGNGEVGDPIIKDKSSISAAKREKQLKNIGLLKRKKASTLERAVKAARSKGVRPQFQEQSPVKDENVDETGKPSMITVQKKKVVKQENPRQMFKSSNYNAFDRMDALIMDEGPRADWVKINVHKTMIYWDWSLPHTASN